MMCVLLMVKLGQAAGETMGCESIRDFTWEEIGSLNTCYLNSNTKIYSEEVSIEPLDSSVLGLYFHKNYKISFLPIGIDKTFPNLID